MNTELKLTRFARYAWFVLAYNLLVIVWGVFLRASKSGDGCGQHWLTCHGEVVPSAPQLKTVIEFSHRITSALDGFIVIGLLLSAFWLWKSDKSASKNRLVLKMAIGSFLFVILEGALGAGLVLTGNTAETLTAARPFWMAGHLITTLIFVSFFVLNGVVCERREAVRFQDAAKGFDAFRFSCSRHFIYWNERLNRGVKFDDFSIGNFERRHYQRLFGDLEYPSAPARQSSDFIRFSQRLPDFSGGLD